MRPPIAAGEGPSACFTGSERNLGDHEEPKGHPRASIAGRDGDSHTVAHAPPPLLPPSLDCPPPSRLRLGNLSGGYRGAASNWRALARLKGKCFLTLDDDRDLLLRSSVDFLQYFRDSHDRYDDSFGAQCEPHRHNGSQTGVEARPSQPSTHQGVRQSKASAMAAVLETGETCK